MLSFHRVCAPLFLAAFLAVTGAAAALAAPRPRAAMKPWIPPFADSLAIWAGEARAKFRTQSGDSVTGRNYPPYDLVGSMGRRLLRALGQPNFPQAHAVETVLDSLGLDTDVVIDPERPEFVLLVARNPFRLTSHAVGYFYWYRGDDLRIQGMDLEGGTSPKMRVWYTGRQDGPYHWGLIDRARGVDGMLGFYLMKLAPNGGAWQLVQYPGAGLDLGTGEGAWVDVNHDGTPEVMAWTPAIPNPLFAECRNCPRVFAEKIYAQRREGFELNDSRIVPTALSNLGLFFRLLGEGNHAGAGRLLETPAKVEEATRLGWGRQQAAGTWKFEYGEDDPWPRWMVLRFKDGAKEQKYRFEFTMKDGRWIIDSWAATTVPPSSRPMGGRPQPPPATGTKPGK